MKIHSTVQSDCSHWPKGRQAIRMLAFCGTVALCVTTCTNANAQTGLFGGAAKSPASQIESSNMVRNGLFTHGADSYRVVNTAAFRTMADVGTTEAGSVAQVGLLGSCGSCGTRCGGSCGGYSACGSCGSNCGGSCGYALGNPCAPCEPFCYALVEGLYMERDGDENFSLSPNFRMNGFDDEYGGRITIGRVPDCVHGYEISYTGQFEWDMAGSASDPGAGIGTFLVAGAPLAPANLSAFSNATFQSQSYQAKYWSAEANKTLMGWDMAKLLLGVRYIEYDEEFNYLSQNATAAGLVRSDVDNQMYGLQVGMDLLYPISKHGYTDFRTRLGAFVNSADSTLRVFNAGSAQVGNFDDTTDIAGVFEVGGGIRYQLGQMLSLRAGAELWYLSGMATSANQFRTNVISPTTGSRVSANDDILITGVSVGAQLKY